MHVNMLRLIEFNCDFPFKKFEINKNRNRLNSAILSYAGFKTKIRHYKSKFETNICACLCWL